MKVIAFSFMFMVLLAAAALADGLKITRIDARVDYDNAYIYRLEQAESLTRKNYALVPLTENSNIAVDVYPGSNLTFTITLENTFNGDTPEIRNIYTKVTIEGKGKEGADVQEKSTYFSIDAGNDIKADIKLYIPFDVESGPHKVTIIAQGVGNHTVFETSISLRLDIKKLGHDLRISKVSLEPSVVSCTRKTKITAVIANAGSNSEDNAALEFKATWLGFDSYDTGIFLSASNDDPDLIKHSKTAVIEVPVFFAAGNYPITVNLFWKNFIVFDQRTLYLTVKDCGITNKTNPKNETNQTIVTPPREDTNIPSSPSAIESSSILNSPMFLFILLGNGIFMTVIAVLVIFGFLRRSKV